MSSLTEIFEGLDSEGVLIDLIGARNINDTGDELIHSCQLNFGLHKNGDQNPSASLNKNTLLFNCFTCGGGSIIWLVENVLGISREQAVAELKNYSKGLVDVPVEKFIERLNKLFKDEKTSHIDIPVYNERILDLYGTVSSYLLDRGVSELTQKEMRTGEILDKYEKTYDDEVVKVERVMIPHFINGKLVGWVARRKNDKLNVAKYKNTKGFPRQHWLYNFDKARFFREVYVVESPMSVLVLKSRGIDNVVATFGAKVTKTQLDLLRSFKQVTVFPDGDAPGREAKKNLVTGLRDFTTVKVIDTPDGEDPASLTEIPQTLSSFEYLISSSF